MAEGKQSKAGREAAVDHVDKSAAMELHMADLGHSVTSHGDGSPTISPDLVERRKVEAEYNDNPDRENVAIAKKLQGK